MKFIAYCRSCYSLNTKSNCAILAPFLVYRMFDIVPESTTNLYSLPNQVNYFPCKTLICDDCGFVGVNILFDDEEMNKLYLNYRDSNYNATRVHFEPNYGITRFQKRDDYVVGVEHFIGKNISNIKSLIDYGGSNGLNTPHIGDSRYIYDISQVNLEDETLVYTPVLFKCDLITCMQVLEHVPDPNIILQEIANNSNYCYFEVPNEHGGKKEFWHEHINSFNITSFTNLISKYFTILDSREIVVIAGGLERNVLQILCLNSKPEIAV